MNLFKIKFLSPKCITSAVLAILVIVAGGVGQPLKAQTSAELGPLIERLRLIDQNLKDLNLVVLGGKKPAARSAAPAPVSAPVNTTTPSASTDTIVRFSALEEQIQDLTGKLERFGFEVGQARTRLDKLIVDIDFRLSAIEQKMTAGKPAQVSGSQVQPGDTMAPGSSPIPVSEGQLAAPGAAEVVVSGNAPGTKVLGTIPAEDVGTITASVAAAPAAPVRPASVLPDGTVRERYNFAYRLLRQLKTAKAETAFKEFLAEHNSDPLAENARYWLGESYYARRDYARAAATFVDAYGKSPQGLKARDNLLKLGMSLSRLDQKSDACASFDELLSLYKTDADAKARKKAVSEKSRAGCE
jgi:tol-pal system protein YbgF